MKKHSILEILNKTGQTADIILGILIGGGNLKTMRRKVFYPTMPDFSDKCSNIERDYKNKRKNNLQSLLYQLKKQGFIKKEDRKRGGLWIITLAGKKQLEKLKQTEKLPKLFYKKEIDDGLNIVIFDIPEKYKTKRNWLRRCLLELEFIMLQKSVWTGKNKLPEEFLKDLEELKIIEFIHIFKVSKTGTLKNKY